VAPQGNTQPPARKRADVLLVERGLFESRARAQAAIEAGLVTANGKLVVKASETIRANADIAAKPAHPWVSRGGVKLAGALEHYPIEIENHVCLDVGASTGGFTDVLLQRGARHVYAVDVGRGQLADRLRHDPRVTSQERTNARTLTAASFPEPIDLAVIDVSFISLDKVLGAVASTLAPQSPIVALVKPQFEAGKGRTDHGVVRDPAIHREVLERVIAAAAERGLGTRAVIASPILGPEGNREFLVHLAPGPGCSDIGDRVTEALDT